MMFSNPFKRLAIASGALLVGFAQNAVGAILRTIAEIFAERISVRDFGGVGDDATDNTDAINKLFAHCAQVGGRPYFPRGVYRTRGGHQYAPAGGIASPYGDGPHSSILKAMNDSDVLTITGASECAVRGLGFDKVDRNQAGRGLVIIGTAYAVIDHVTVYGFGSGFYTQGVLTTLFIKPLARFCGYGMYLDYGSGSNPNAITILSPSLSLNSRWGLRADQSASLSIKGGSCEGNGWGVESFHGGMVFFNAGGEGGVGVTVDGVHMEQNRGEADIYIATTMNPGTVYNVRNCPIFPIDDTNVTANRIFVEQSVQVNLNVQGNSFKHFGSYTPNAARKYIATIDTTLLYVNTGGDMAQFYSQVEAPDLRSWGPLVVRDAMLSAACCVLFSGGNAVLRPGAYNVKTVARTGVGTYVVTFVKPMPLDTYRISPCSDTAAKSINWTAKAGASFTLQARDLNGNLVDCGFDVTVNGGLS